MKAVLVGEVGRIPCTLASCEIGVPVPVAAEQGLPG